MPQKIYPDVFPATQNIAAEHNEKEAEEIGRSIVRPGSGGVKNEPGDNFIQSQYRNGQRDPHYRVANPLIGSIY